jgi:membrane associated rhomboid family serine protease
LSDTQPPTFLDQLVEWLAQGMDAIGLNGRRLLWRWNQRKEKLGEAGARTAMLWRSAKGKHKMCPACRALVPREAATCSDCGASLSKVSVPSASRLFANVMPGAMAASSIIMLVNGLIFLMMMMAPASDSATGQPGIAMTFDNFKLLRFGAFFGILVRLDGEWWRMISSPFLHGGLIHFGMNSFVLVRLGPIVEQLYGKERFWLIYLVSGFSGNIAALVFRTEGSVVGASGAIVGMIGLLLAYGVRMGPVAGSNIRSAMMQNVVFIFFMSLLPGISFLSHAGGFVGGFLAGLAIQAPTRGASRSDTIWQWLSLASVLLVLYAFYNVALHGQDYVKHLE